jgi:hypothetical protein
VGAWPDKFRPVRDARDSAVVGSGSPNYAVMVIAEYIGWPEDASIAPLIQVNSLVMRGLAMYIRLYQRQHSVV